MNDKKIRTAVILAAGERKWFNKPVGFLDLEETTVIERLINILNTYEVDKIILVVGYRSEYYEELSLKKSLTLVHSNKYKWTGTMHSLYLAKEVIEDDFILVESDVVFEERAINHLLKNKDENSVLITSESGSGDEVFVEVKNHGVFRMSKDIHQLGKIDGEFIGLSKISYNTYKAMIEDFETHNRNLYLNYEYSLINNTEVGTLGYEKLDDLVWTEIDTEENYNNLKHVIYPKLKRKEIQVREEYVKECISNALDIEQNRIIDIERLGGRTNKNYSLVIDGERYVTRLPGNGTEKFIDRLNEKINSAIAYDLGLDSETIYFDENSGLKVTKFIPEAETLNPTTGKKVENIILMAKGLRVLHTSGRKFHMDFNPFRSVEFYEKAVVEANGKLFDGFEEVKNKCMALEKRLDELGLTIAPCHIDPLPENFIRSGKDRIYIIDWEYSGNYDAMWDVAAVSLECNLSEDEENLLLEEYFGQYDVNVIKEKVLIHKVMQDMFWCTWAAAKVAKGDEYLYNYSIFKFARVQEHLKNIKPMILN